MHRRYTVNRIPQEVVDLMEAQFHYLMMGIRWTSEWKRWHPEKCIERIVQKREIFPLFYPPESQSGEGAEGIS